MAVFGVLGVACALVEAAPAEGSLPMTFRAEDLTLRFSRHSGSAAQLPHVVLLSGAEGGTLEHSGKKSTFRYALEDRVALLDELFKMHFFSLPQRYSARSAAQLGAGGTVNVVGADTTGSSGNSVCVSVGAFEKCVIYGSNGPFELDELAKHVFDKAQRLAR